MASSWEKSWKRRFKARKISQPKKPADSHRGNPEANPVPGIDLPLCHEPWKLSMSLEELLEMPSPESEPILPGLIEKGQTTLVRIAPGVDYKWYLNGVAVAITAGISRLLPYGEITQCNITLAYIGSISQRTREQLDMYRDKILNDIRKKQANQNLHVVSLRDIQKQKLMDDQYWHSENTDALIQTEKGLVIVPDAHLSIGTHKDSWKEIGGDLAFKRINDSNMAALICFQADKRTWESMQDSIWTRRSYRFVEFLPWPASPQQYGSGFTIKIHKTSEHDPTPLMFDVWYWVQDGRIELGWQIHDETALVSSKQTQIAERRRQVADYLERNIPQKEIATILKIDESTISRDVQAIKSARAAREKNAAKDRDVDEAV